MSPSTRVADVISTVKSMLEPVGFEVHAFKIGWYNDQVIPSFKFDKDYDTLALVIISTAAMFDKAFKPFVCQDHCKGVRDPIDECIAHHFNLVKKEFTDCDVETIHDFEVNPANRRPRVLVQTAGHVAGGAYYYQKSDVKNSPWKEKQKIFGVSVHPVHGGWFALRGVIIFNNITCPDLPQKEPLDCVPTDEMKIELLERYNFRWQDWSFRDIVPVEENDKYSEEQKTYFSTLPRDRLKLLGIEKETQQ